MNEHQSEAHGEAASGERLPETPPRIWVGSLADYNQGQLHGEWLDADQEPDELRTAVQAMLSRSPTPGAEEWGIFDHDGFHGARVHEYESLEVVSQLARGVAEHGGTFAAWAQLVDNEPDALARFQESYLGRFDSRGAFAQHIVDELADWDNVTQDIPAWLAPHVSINFEALAQDMELSIDVRFVDAGEGGVWVFEGRL